MYVGFGCLFEVAGSYAMLDKRTPSGPEGSSGSLNDMCRRVPGHFFISFESASQFCMRIRFGLPLKSHLPATLYHRFLV